MAKGSQLTQLKSALTSAGLDRKKQQQIKAKSNNAGTKRKRGPDDEKKLEKIRKEMNPFEERTMRLKHDIGGRKLKGSSGRPGLSKQTGLEERQRTLLPALQNRNHTTTFQDRRFGESNPTLTPEEKMLERFTREKQAQRSALGGASGRGKGKELFNLGDDEAGMEGFGEDEVGWGGGAGAGGEEWGLTHGGRSLEDDFELGGFGAGEDDEDRGQIDRRTVQKSHFGGFEEEDNDSEDDKPERKRSKAEIMAEVIAKSKDHKYARQMEKEKDEATRLEIDNEFADIRDMLMGMATLPDEDPEEDAFPGTKANQIPLGVRAGGPVPTSTTTTTDATIEGDAKAEPSAESLDYDTFVRSLAFDRRAKPTDRTKTEDELLLEEKERLEEAERKRLRRQQGLASDSEDEGAAKSMKAKREREKRNRGADDLDDDFAGEDGMEGVEDGEFGLGGGLEKSGGPMVMLSGSESEGEDDDEEGSDDEDEEGSDEDDESEDDEEDDGFSDLEGSQTNEALPDDEDDADELEEPTPAVSAQKATRKSSKKKSTAGKAKELPFTFPCPTTHEDLLDMLEEHDVVRDEDVELVIKRIRAVWHPKLGEGNKERMQIFSTILLDHALYVLSSPTPNFALLSLLLPHLSSLTTAYPLISAQHTISKLSLINRNLSLALSRGPLALESQTWPSSPELGLLRIIGITWSTSDFSHPVSAPAVLLIGRWLSQSKVRGILDLSKGLFLCSLFLQYEALSKRFMPEVLNFLSFALLILSPSTFNPSTPLPGTFPFPDVFDDRYKPLKIRSVKSTENELPVDPAPTPSITDLLSLENGSKVIEEQVKVDLMGVALRLISKSRELWAGSDAYVEMFRPVEDVLKGLKVKKLPAGLQALHKTTLSTLSNTLKFSLQARRPLRLQNHKPIPIPSYIPKFEGSFYTPGKRYDPDAERNAASKLRSQYKQEKKGAIRELRKDAKFLSAERNRVKDEKDKAYEQRMRSAHGAIQVERSEEKQMEREKARDKKRAGK
ncbi:Nucleolar protein involved in 40S ribosome biogenesis [Phaffia rhodozyma]|uniref:Nucleolar protein involved in 40S ribosome biogenesis n=1 Tax=Phaffia rhodozyma TaxID=264483 RepID=A0A0F7SI16_PHARH|nr:Nucleolar protein involved in 40S ribosome biogenesis [Phaffia rhodozyma]